MAAVREARPSSEGVNHVERRSRAVRTCGPVNVEASPSPPTTVTVCARPDGLGETSMSASGGAILSLLATAEAGNRTGPQSWYGEVVSYGSLTETRYGTAMPNSLDEAVRPPDVEKYSVSATFPA